MPKPTKPKARPRPAAPRQARSQIAPRKAPPPPRQAPSQHDGEATTEEGLSDAESAPETPVVAAAQCIFPGIDPAFVGSVYVRRMVAPAKQSRFPEYRRVEGDWRIPDLIRNRASCEDEILRVAGGGRYKIEARDHDNEFLSAVAVSIEGLPKTPGGTSAPNAVNETPTGIITLAGASPDTNAVLMLAQQFAQEAKKESLASVQHLTETYKAALATVAAHGASASGQDLMREVASNLERLRAENTRLQTDNTRLVAENAELKIKVAAQHGPLAMIFTKLAEKGAEGLPEMLRTLTKLLGEPQAVAQLEAGKQPAPAAENPTPPAVS